MLVTSIFFSHIVLHKPLSIPSIATTLEHLVQGDHLMISDGILLPHLLQFKTEVSLINCLILEIDNEPAGCFFRTMIFLSPKVS